MSELVAVLHHAWAALFGYFWLACPLCGRHFGGHQWRSYGGKWPSIPSGEPGKGRAICPACTKAGLGSASY